MSYSSESVLAASAKLRDVAEMLSFLKFQRVGTFRADDFGQVEQWCFFDASDYRSWSGVDLWLYEHDGHVTVETRTPVGRSYYDLVHQNRTISVLRRRFGGDFTTGEGRGRYLRPDGLPPSPSASGCYLAFQSFGFNLIRVLQYLDSRQFAAGPRAMGKRFKFLLEIDPRVIANNTLIPFFVAAVEDYLKSVFVALLRYSERRVMFLRSMPLHGDDLGRMAEKHLSVDEAVADSISFQRIPAVFQHYEALVPRLDLAGTLRRPYRRRKQSLLEQLEALIKGRHALIHGAELDVTLTDEYVTRLIYDLDATVTRIQTRICHVHRWPLERGWWLGNPRARLAAELQTSTRRPNMGLNPTAGGATEPAAG